MTKGKKSSSIIDSMIISMYASGKVSKDEFDSMMSKNEAGRLAIIDGKLSELTADQLELADRADDTDEKKSKASGKSGKAVSRSSKAKAVIDKAKEACMTKESIDSRIGTLCSFGKVQAGTVSVTIGDHDIHYKEQLWGVPTRVVEYTVDPVKFTAERRNLAQSLGLSQNKIEQIVAGDAVLFKVVTYESIPLDTKILGYIILNSDKSSRIILNSTLLKEKYINESALIKKLGNVIKTWIK